MIYFRRVVGDSMHPAYKDGQLVVVSHFKKPVKGSTVIAVQNGKEVMKRIESIDSNQMVELRGDNTEHSTDSRKYGKIPKRHILGVVIWPNN